MSIERLSMLGVTILSDSQFVKTLGIRSIHDWAAPFHPELAGVPNGWCSRPNAAPFWCEWREALC